MKSKTKNFISKKRKVMDTKISISTIVSHALTNFTHAFISGFLIAIVGSYNYIYIGITYLVFKRFDGIVIGRGGYESNFGTNYLFPIPSTIGFLLGCYISELLKLSNIL